MPDTISDHSTSSISDTILQFINAVSLARSPNTSRTYRNGLTVFLSVLREKSINPDSASIEHLSEDSIIWFCEELKGYSPTTERLYLTAAAQFFEYLAGENIIPVNLPRIRLLIRQRARRPGIRLPQFPKNSIEKVLEYAETLREVPSEGEEEKLRNLRDRAFLITLADTGLRVHEACNLRRGDIDWEEGNAQVIGKGNRQSIVRFSRRAQKAIKDYLALRARIDGSTGKPIASLPLFARHDQGAGKKKSKPITTATGRNIVSQRVKEVLGNDAQGSITPHSFRHYFVTRVLQSTGNLKLAQELARHQNISVTTRYAHLSNDELDKGYWNVFEEESE
jgi:integrase/recombinase XerC